MLRRLSADTREAIPSARGRSGFEVRRLSTVLSSLAARSARAPLARSAASASPPAPLLARAARHVLAPTFGNGVVLLLRVGERR